MAENSSSSSGGAGFFSLLSVLFIGLKLTHIIDWSWWWILSPLWGGFALFIGLIFALFIGLIVVFIFCKILEDS